MAKKNKQLQKDKDFNALQQFDTFFKSCPSMMSVSRVSDRTFVQVNDAFVSILGYSKKEIIGKTGQELNLYNDETQQKKASDILASKGRMKEVEVDVKTRDGKLLNGLFSGEIITVEGIEYILSVMTDVTEQIRLEQELNTTFEYAAVGIANVSSEGKYLKVNRCMCEITGYSKEELVGKNYREITHPDDLAVDEDIMQKLISGEINTCIMEKRYICKDDSIVWAKLSISGARDKNDNLDYIIVVVQNISKQKKAETALKDSEARFKALHNATFGGIAIHDKGLILDCNQGLADMTGFSVEELIGMDCLLIFSEKTREYVIKNIQNGYEKPYEAVGLRKDGSEYSLRVEAKNIPYKGKTVRVVEFRDISESKEAAKEHASIMAAIDQLAESVMITDSAGYIVYVNPGFSNITGYSYKEVIGRNTAFLESGMHNEGYYQNIYSVINQGKTWKGRFTNLKKDGTTFVSEALISPIKDDDGKIINLVAVEQDVTEIVANEEALQQSQKMESIGKLAGGVAHDFNNLLMAIMGYVDLCRDELEPEHPVVELLNEITSAADRSVLITKQLLAFARKQNISPKVINLNEAISGMLKLLSRMVGEDVTLNWVPCDDPWMIRIDPGQVDQIMTNLFVNARDAIDGVGNIMIETYQTEVNSDYAVGDSAGVAKGQYMVVAFSDDGCGMDKKTQSNAFEPFFTTKDIGKGTGLGLATIYGIAGQNDGYVNVYSEPGQGTTFRIYLPRFNVENADSPDTLLQDASDEIQGGSETILLVEDEKNIRVITSLILEKLGYKIILADKPESAMKISNEYEEEIDMLFTDVVLPGQNGTDLAKELEKTRPNMKQLFMSGYTANVVFQQDIITEEMNFLPKPFSRETLATKIRQILDKPQ